MSEQRVRTVLTGWLDSPVEVGTYRGVDGVWAKVDLDPRIDDSMRPTSLTCTGTVVDEMKVRFVGTTAPRERVLTTLSRLEDSTPAAGAVTAENHDLSADAELWPHIFYEGVSLTRAAKCLAHIEREPLPTYGD